MQSRTVPPRSAEQRCSSSIEAPRLSARWRRLLLDPSQLGIDASPSRRRRCPDRHRRDGEIRVVESADANENEMGTRLGLAEERRPAHWTKAPVHAVATVREAGIITGLPDHRERVGAEAGVYRSAAAADILAVPAPTHARDHRRRRAFPSNRPAQAATCYRHVVLLAAARSKRTQFAC